MVLLRGHVDHAVWRSFLTKYRKACCSAIVLLESDSTGAVGQLSVRLG
jgi:hypothetical protein